MSRGFAGQLFGSAESETVKAIVTSGEHSVLIIRATTADLLSSASRALVRDLRAAGGRTEFHAPGDADTLLQSANRLLADIPLESILTSATGHPPHLLVIDEAEGLSAIESSSLRRIAIGLQGSAFRVLLLVRHPAASLRHLPLGELADIAMVWDLDDVERKAEEPLVGAELAREARSAPTKTQPPAPRADKVAPNSDARLRDVLAELAKERAATRGFDVTTPRKLLSTPVKAIIAVSVMLLAGYALYDFWLRDTQIGPFVYDCGLHADREQVDILLSQIGRSAPTRVIDEDGKYRVQVGPFSGRTAAEAARQLVWRLGACRVEPVVARTNKSSTAKSGG